MEKDTQLARWLAGEMEGSELDALQKSPEYPTLLKIKTTFDGIEAPQFESEAMLRDIVSTKKLRSKVVPLYQRNWFRYAAVVVILLGVAAFFALPSRQIADNGEMLAFTLPDQSEVILNAGSQVKYQTYNWANNREVSLTGEAFFKVAKGKSFAVATDLGTVTVLGTQFGVKARGQNFDVVCYEGKVSVLYGKHRVILLKGQRVDFGTGASGAIQMDTAAEPEWLHSEIVASHESLSEIITEIERQYDVVIHVATEPTQLFSGSLPADDLDAALRIICATFHLKVQKMSGEITLVPADAHP